MELLTQPNDWLSRELKPFDFEEHDAPEVAKELATVMVNHKGVGISANQVGLDAQVFVMELTSGEVIGIFNPQILEVSDDTVLALEGCLSSPGLWIKVNRPKTIQAVFYDQNQLKHALELTGRDARCFLHEYDHLQGIDFTDRVSKLKLDRAKKKLKKDQKRIAARA